MFRKLLAAGFTASILLTGYTSTAQYTLEQFVINHRSGARPSGLVAVDTVLHFSATDGIHGIEPWTCDGTLAGTKMTKDIVNGTMSSTGALLGVLNGSSIFISNDQTHGFEPWISDGTANGTQLLKDIYTGSPYSINTNAPSSAVIGNKIYFTADDGPHGKELWVTDGTTNGTVLLKDINTGIRGSQPSHFVAYNNKIYFTALDDTHGRELWVTDGTTNGTKMVIDAVQGLPHSYINHIIVYNNKLYYTGYLNQKHGLIESNGTDVGTKFIAEVGVGSVSGKESNIVLFNSKMYFGGADTSYYTNGVELWESDGTTNGTKLVKEINPSFGKSSNPYLLTVVDSQLFFAADDGVHNHELWVTDGTTNGTKMVKNISTHPTSGSGPLGLTAYKHKLIFVAKDSSGNSGLWVSDGTSNGTEVIRKYDRTTMFSPGSYFTICNNSLYFSAYDTSGNELWKLTDTTKTTPPPTSVTTKQAISEIKVSPNPAHDIVYITLDKEYGQAQLSIADLTGKVILRNTIDATQKYLQVRLPKIPSGIYLLNISHKEGTFTERLLIE